MPRKTWVTEMIYSVIPYESVGPIKFGFTQLQTEQAIGPSDFTNKNRYGNIVEYRNNKTLTCIYKKDTLNLTEVNFSSPGDIVTIDQKNIWDINFTEILELSKQSPVYQGFGSVVIFDFGVALTGFFPREDEIKAINVFSKGRWDDLLPSMKRLLSR